MINLNIIDQKYNNNRRKEKIQFNFEKLIKRIQKLM